MINSPWWIVCEAMQRKWMAGEIDDGYVILSSVKFYIELHYGRESMI